MTSKRAKRARERDVILFVYELHQVVQWTRRTALSAQTRVEFPVSAINLNRAMWS
jgi:hypothetical protein